MASPFKLDAARLFVKMIAMSHSRRHFLQRLAFYTGAFASMPVSSLLARETPVMKRVPDEKCAAICGLFCGTCPSYPEDCHGCLSDKLTPACSRCANGFRTCAKEHGISRCYECADFPCARLESFSQKHWEKGIGHHLRVIDDLRAMKELGLAAWVAQQTHDNTCARCGQLIYWMDKKSHQC